MGRHLAFNNVSGRLCIGPTLSWTQNRRHLASSHKRDKKVFIFPNTPKHLLHIPEDYNVCQSIDSFKIKSLSGGFQRRPELIANHKENKNYHQSLDFDVFKFPTHKTVQIQLELAEKAICLLDSFLSPISSDQSLNEHTFSQLVNPKLALDVGCGHGFSMVPLIHRSYVCIGADIHADTLSYIKQDNMKNKSSKSVFSAKKNRIFSGLFNVIQWDLQHGLPFRDQMFDLATSISFLQWLFYGQKRNQIGYFFASLHKVLCNKGKAVIQFYPQNPKQLFVAIDAASLHFKGAVVGDFPHKERGLKLFLLLLK